jgi:hypothetical protein
VKKIKAKKFKKDFEIACDEVATNLLKDFNDKFMHKRESVQFSAKFQHSSITFNILKRKIK